MKELEKLREIFLTDVDEETRADNAEQLREWEQGLRASKAFIGWQQHEVTRSILEQARKTYIDSVIAIGRGYNIDDVTRARLWAHQNAALWLISLIGKDAKAELSSLEYEIRRALNATNGG